MNRLTQKLIMATLALIPCLGYATAYRSVLVTYHDGSAFYLKGEQNLTMTTDNNEVKFFTTGEIHVSFPVDSIKGFSLSPREGDIELSALEEVTADNISFERKGTTLIFGNLTGRTHISLTTLSGIVVYSAEAEGKHTIDISQLPGGIYLISVNHKTFKIFVER